MVDRFTLSSNKLDMMIKNQQAIFDKARLGYKSYYKKKYINNLYKKSSKDNIVYFCYGKLGHKTYSCNIRKSPHLIKTKQVWIVKKSLVDKIERPKMTGIPNQT